MTERGVAGISTQGPESQIEALHLHHVVGYTLRTGEAEISCKYKKNYGITVSHLEHHVLPCRDYHSISSLRSIWKWAREDK